MKVRTWLSIITLIILGIVIYLARREIADAIALLGQVDVMVSLLLIPVQFISYYATGGIIFSYLRAKGNVRDMSQLTITRMALELNFVNHVFPSGGAAGFSYLGWLLSHHGVTVGRATMAQIIRFFLTFASFALLLVVSVAFLAFDHQINRTIVLLSAGVAALILIGSAVGIWAVSSRKRLQWAARFVTRFSNAVVRWWTRGRKSDALHEAVLLKFVHDIHDDYRAIMKDKLVLWRPFVWATIANIADAALIFIAFWALGVTVNPATVFIAYGLSSIAGALVLTPGGAGAYEAAMIAFLAMAGVSPGVAIAGTLLARVLLTFGTILGGYGFYQLTLLRYGKRST